MVISKEDSPDFSHWAFPLIMCKPFLERNLFIYQNSARKNQLPYSKKIFVKLSVTFKKFVPNLNSESTGVKSYTWGNRNFQGFDSTGPSSNSVILFENVFLRAKIKVCLCHVWIYILWLVAADLIQFIFSFSSCLGSSWSCLRCKPKFLKGCLIPTFDYMKENRACILKDL